MSNDQWEQVYGARRRAGACSTARRWSSSTRGAWPSARRAISASGSARKHVAAHHGSLAKEAAPRCRAAPEARRAEGAGRDRVARARHRHRRRRPRLPARLAALDRRPSCSASAAPATRSAACRRRGCFRSRATSWSNARRCSTACGAASSTRCACRRRRSTCWPSRSSPRVACREWDEDALFALVRARLAVRASCARERLRRGRAHARRGLHARATGTRAGYVHRDAVHQSAARAQGRAPDRADLGRHDSRDRRLRGRARAAGARRSARVNEDFAVESIAGDVFQLGNTSYRILRVEPGRVRVEDAHGARAEHPVLARRGARAQRRAVARRVAAARRGRARADRARARRRRPSTGWSRRSASTRTRRASSSTTWRAPLAALGALPTQRAHRARALLRRVGRHAAGHPFAVRQPHQPRLGPGAAQALLPQVQLRAAGRGDRGRDRAVAVDQPQLPARRGRALPAFGHGARRAGAGAARRAAVRRALALERDHRARAAALHAAARRSRRSCSA